MITKEQIQEFFDDLARKRVSLKRPMRWELVFCDHDRARLETLEPELRIEGYSEIELLEPSPEDDDDEDDELWFLQAARIELLTPQALYSRCKELTALGRKYGVEEFDGFDVSNVDQSPLY